VSHFLDAELRRSKYRLLGLVGQGQFGRVYCASHRKTGKLVALKELSKDRFPTNKFLRELRFLVSLQHPNIVACHALEHIQTRRYLVMDYCEGGTLRSLLESEYQLHPALCLSLIQDILTGLDHAHQHQIIHCDIKPENILLSIHANGWMAKISDFGIARLSQELSTEVVGNTGSPAYMSPERFYGQNSFTADLYAVGILLYELFTGHRPFSGTPIELMSAHLNKPVTIPETIPEPLHPIILTALQKLPARRYQSASEMLAALQDAETTIREMMSSAWVEAPLLKAMKLSVKPVDQYLHQLTLVTEIHQILPIATETISDESPQPESDRADIEGQSSRIQVLLVSGKRVIRQSLITASASTLQTLVVTNTVRLLEPLDELLSHPNGYLAIAQRSIYRLSPNLFQTRQIEPEGHLRSQLLESSTTSAVPELVAEFGRAFIAAIAPSHDWMVTAKNTRKGSIECVEIWRLGAAPAIVKRIKTPNQHLFRLIALDNRHFVTCSHVADCLTDAYINGVLIKTYTRRGNEIGSLTLPLPLHKVLTITADYKILATEPGNSNTILLLHLKPLQIRRISLESEPIRAVVVEWGYVVVSENGLVTLLNSYAEPIACFRGPTNVTAIAVVDSYTLLLATWHSQQGCLYTVDLRNLDLDIIF